MEWNMEWKIFGMEWKWNGRKLPVWNMKKSSSIPFHTMPWFQTTWAILRIKGCTLAKYQRLRHPVCYKVVSKTICEGYTRWAKNRLTTITIII